MTAAEIKKSIAQGSNVFARKAHAKMGRLATVTVDGIEAGMAVVNGRPAFKPGDLMTLADAQADVAAKNATIDLLIAQHRQALTGGSK